MPARDPPAAPMPLPALYDTHCHLAAPEFDSDRDLVIDRARAAGVRRALAVASDLEDCWRVLEAAARHQDFLVPALGLHPDSVAGAGDGEVEAILDLIRARAPALGAVGEVGLDHRPCWDERVRARQEEVFRTMIRLAGVLDLPLSVHSRSAGHRTVAILREEGARSVSLHAFDGRPVYAEAAAAAGFRLSVPPSVLRSAESYRFVTRVPVGALLLESDAPVLGPDKSSRNEPANLAPALREIARRRGVAVEDLAARIGETTAALFPKLTTGAGPGNGGGGAGPVAAREITRPEIG